MAVVAAILAPTFALSGRAVRAGDPPVAAPASPPAAPAAPKQDPLPPGIVARVRGQDVTLADFRLKLAEAVKDELGDPRSGPATVLAILVEETVVQQEADRLGIRVTNADYAKRYDEIDAQVRVKTGGKQTLADVMREKKTPPEEFRARLEDQIRKERIASDPSHLGATLPKDESARIAQIEVVIGELMKKSKIEREGLPDGIVARVNGATINAERYGTQLYLRLANSEVARRLQEHCLTVLLNQEGLQFTPAQVGEALELERPLWARMTDEAIDDAHRTLSFENFLSLRYNAPIGELKTSPYRRGLFALRMKFWKTVTDDDIALEFGRGADKQYGATIVVTEFVVSFEIEKAIMTNTPRRARDDAQRLAADILRRGRSGETAASLMAEIVKAKTRSPIAQRRALLPQGDKGNDQPLFDAVKGIPDGTWNDHPIESMSAFHVLYRETLRPAPTFARMRDVVRHNIVDVRARDWIDDVMRTQVQIAR
jgi:hypothetical protein